MIRIKEKLNSNAGASMILALALMLVCVVVSSIIVPAAASGISRNYERTTQQREYLAVSSAAELIADELETAGEYVAKKEIKQYGCLEYQKKELENFEVVNDEEENTTYKGYRLNSPLTNDAILSYLLADTNEEGEDSIFCSASSESTIIEDNPSQLSGSLQGLLKVACESVIKNEESYKGIFYISVENEERLPKVKCELTMDTNYDITILISPDSDNTDYSISVFMEADEVNIKTADDSGKTVTTTCENHHKVLNIKEDGSVYIIEEYQFVKTNNCSTIEISWQEPVITKGGQ